MIIVLSPAKTLDYETPMNGIDYTVANHLSKSAELIKTLKSYETEDISKLMGLSSNLAFLNFERYQSWKRPTKPSADARQAVFAFQGDVYQGLDVATLKKRDLKSLNNFYTIKKNQVYSLEKLIKIIQTSEENLSNLQIFNDVEISFWYTQEDEIQIEVF